MLQPANRMKAAGRPAARPSPFTDTNFSATGNS